MKKNENRSLMDQIMGLGEGLTKLISSTKYTFENCYVGDLSCMTDESDKNAQVPEKHGTVLRCPMKSRGRLRKTNVLDNVFSDTTKKTVVHVIKMSKIKKGNVKDQFIRDLYRTSSFSYIWNYIGKEILDALDNESEDIKVIYFPNIIIPSSVSEIYFESDNEDKTFNVLMLIVPNSYYDRFDDERKKTVDLLQKAISACIFKKNRDIILDASSFTKNSEMLIDIGKNMVQDANINKYIDQVFLDNLYIDNPLDFIEIGFF